MSFHLSKKSILKKTAQVSMLTLLSRILGIFREFLMVRYLGVGAVSDAFIAAFKLPNFFRHIFAEGALNASFVPVMVKTVKDGNRAEANGLMTISFLFFEGLVLLIYLFVLIKTNWVLLVLAPGFSAEQVAYTIPFLRILFSFLFFISSSALLSGALNAVNHFFVPAFGTPLWNMIYIGSLVLCLSYALPVTYLCVGIIFGAFVLFALHLVVFFKHNFTFGRIDAGSIAAFKSVMAKFLPCLFGVSIVELNLFISGSIASFLPKGSISLLYYGSRFMNIPLGMFAVAFSSIMLPHFSRLVLYAPRRLNFYLLEIAKFVTWIILPAMLFLMFVSRDLFIFLLGAKATPSHVHQGCIILILYSSGLLFLCVNKILLSMFYALKDTWSTTLAAGLCALINVVGDLLGIWLFGVYGIGAANTIAALAMTLACLIFLHKRHKLSFYVGQYLHFFVRYLLQLACGCALFVGSYRLAQHLLTSIGYSWFMTTSYGFFMTACMLIAVTMIFLFITRNLFGLKVYFLKR